MHHASTGKTILVVEDDDVARAGLAALLEPHGYHVVTVPDGNAALDVLAGELHPSLVLLDMIIHGIDGWQFLARRQKDKDLAAIPVIIMTGLGIASEAWATAMGASDLLRKPIDANFLLHAVRQHALPHQISA